MMTLPNEKYISNHLKYWKAYLDSVADRAIINLIGEIMPPVKVNKDQYRWELIFPNRKEMALTLFRIQEFAASEYVRFAGVRFSTEEFLDAYMNDDMTVSYFAEKSFSFPGDALVEFIKAFHGHMTEREIALLQELGLEEIQFNPYFNRAHIGARIIATHDHEPIDKKLQEKPFWNN
jgi:hypothetical protein